MCGIGIPVIEHLAMLWFSGLAARCVSSCARFVVDRMTPSAVRKTSHQRRLCQFLRRGQRSPPPVWPFDSPAKSTSLVVLRTPFGDGATCEMPQRMCCRYRPLDEGKVVRLAKFSFYDGVVVHRTQRLKLLVVVLVGKFTERKRLEEGGHWKADTRYPGGLLGAFPPII